MGRTASLGVSWWLGLLVSCLSPCSAAPPADTAATPDNAPPRRRLKVEIDDIFDAEVKRRSTRLVAPVGEPHLVKSIFTTEQRRIKYLLAFEDGVQSGLLAREQHGLCGTVSDEDRPGLYGYSAGLGAVSALRAEVYQEIVAHLATRRDKLRLGRCAAMLRQAVKADDVAGMTLLLKQGAEPDTIGDFNHTALCEAAIYRKYEMAALLLKHGASVHRTWTSWGSSAMRSACGREPDSALNWLDLLLKHGGDPDELDPDGTPLLFMVGDERVLARLIQAKVNIHAVDAGGRTALHVASKPEMVKALVAVGLDVNARADDGSTPLHDAADKAMAAALLSAGAELNAARADGRTPLDMAKEEELRAFLLRQGARGTTQTWAWTQAMMRLDEGVSEIILGGRDRQLREVFDILSIVFERSLYIDWNALKGAGVTDATAVPVNFSGDVPAQDELRAILFRISPKLTFDVDSTGTVLVGTLESLKPLMASDAARVGRALDPRQPAAQLEAEVRLRGMPEFRLENLEGMTVRQAVEKLASVTGAKPVIYWASLKKAGLAAEARVALPVRDVPVVRAIEMVLAKAGARSWRFEVGREGEVIIAAE